MNDPLVSIIIPTYNRAHLIGETLESVITQTYVNWECIVVDDGSTDNTSEILKSYSAKDNRIQYHQRPSNRPKGANACRNLGFELSKGDYIQFLDSDDLLSMKKLHNQIYLAQKTQAELITCKWGRFINPKDFKIKETLLYKDFNPAYKLLIAYGAVKSFLPSHIFLIKRDVLLSSGLWDEALSINQDGEFFCRVISQSNKVVFDKDSHVKYRFANDNKTSQLSTLYKAKDLTKSWKLIEKFLSKKDAKIYINYVDYGKTHAFNLLKVDFKNEIFKNFYFYRKQLKTLFLKKINLK